MQTVSFAGSSYNIPNTRGDRPWSGLSDFVIAAASKAINTAGGNFTLLADINFGASFGIVSTYYKSRTANVASAGQLRLASADVISWRNNANGANIDLSKDTSDNLKYNATKVLLSGAVVNADINASAAIAYSKLNLATSILNADINASAAIALTKLAALSSHSRALVSDSSGFIAEATTTATEIGYVNGVTSAIQTQIDTKAKTDLSNLASTAVNTDIAMGSHKLTGLSAGSAAGNSVRFEQLKVIQVVYATSTAGFSTTSSTYQSTNLTGSITPTSVSNRVLVMAFGMVSIGANNDDAFISIFNGSTNLLAANGQGGPFCNGTGITTLECNGSAMVVDSPASTSAQTYTVKLKNTGNVATAQFGRTGSQTLIMVEVV